MKRLLMMLLAGVMLATTACSSGRAIPAVPVPAPMPPTAKPGGPAATACSAEPAPADPEQNRQAWLVPSKDKAAPGDQLTFEVRTAAPAEITRGIDAYLECWNGTQWVATHLLVTGSNPTAHPIGENVAIIDIAMIGPGPENVVLPADLSPGSYRIRRQVTLTAANGQGQSATAYGRIEIAN